MSKIFQHSVLRYVPSEGSGEVLNLGVLFLFSKTNLIKFIYPSQIARLTQAFPGSSERVIKAYLKGIEKKAEYYSYKPEIWEEFQLNSKSELFINKFLLLPDASTLRFSPVKKAVKYAASEHIIKDYQKKYLGYYDRGKTRSAHDEDYLRNRYKSSIQIIQFDLKHKLKENYQLKYQDEPYQFDFYWKGDRQNLVKAVSLDVKRSDTIQRKTQRYFGQLTLLQPLAKKGNFKFNLLLARPTSKELFKYYDRATKTLMDAPNTQVWEEENIVTFSKQTARELSLFSQ
ncbi:MAG: DUF3037 domain-containing protein [Bacteroidota bacterium]